MSAWVHLRAALYRLDQTSAPSSSPIVSLPSRHTQAGTF